MEENKKEDLAWVIYQLKANELAMKSNVITENMYIFAKENLQKEKEKIEKCMLQAA